MQKCEALKASKLATNYLVCKRAGYFNCTSLLLCPFSVSSHTEQPKPSSKVKPSEFFPKNYAVDIHKPRDENGGGVLIAIKKGIVADEVTLKASSTGEIVCARIKLAKSDPLYVLAFYRPPDDTVDSLKCLESVLEELSKLSQKHPKSTIILG